MQKTVDDPSVLSVARRAGILPALVDANDKLDIIQKGLNDYLETKRLVRAVKGMFFGHFVHRAAICVWKPESDT